MCCKIYNEYHLDVKHYEYEKFFLGFFWSLQYYLQVIPYTKTIKYMGSFCCIVALSTTFLKKKRNLQYAKLQRASTKI